MQIKFDKVDQRPDFTDPEKADQLVNDTFGRIRGMFTPVQMKPDSDGIHQLGLNQGEQYLYNHHLKNVQNNSVVWNENGSYSSVLNIGINHNGREYNIPTIYDGQVLQPEEAIRRAEEVGWDKFPSYSSPQEAHARYADMHKFMELDKLTRPEQPLELEFDADEIIADTLGISPRYDLEIDEMPYPISPKFRDAVVEMSTRLKAKPAHILAAMAFETGGTFSAKQKNAAGSGATGLIQFMPKTARALGTSVEDLAKMSDIQQLEYVERYLRPYTGRMKTLSDVYMAILWPKAVGKPEDYVLFSRANGRTYAQNKGLDFNKDGNITKAEAAAKVQKAAARFTEPVDEEEDGELMEIGAKGRTKKKPNPKADHVVKDTPQGERRVVKPSFKESDGEKIEDVAPGTKDKIVSKDEFVPAHRGEVYEKQWLINTGNTSVKRTL